MKVLPTQNTKWGFWGTAKNVLKTKEKTQDAWDEAFTLIREIAEFSPLETVALLDSRYGRHMADEFLEELDGGDFAKAFKKKVNKDRLYREFNHYIDPTAYKPKKSYHNENFCKDLKRLSKLYGITLQAVGGVKIHGKENMKGFKGYTNDLDSGDLMPIWED